MYLAALYDIPLIVSYVVLTKNIQEEHSRYAHFIGYYSCLYESDQ